MPTRVIRGHIEFNYSELYRILIENVNAVASHDLTVAIAWDQASVSKGEALVYWNDILEKLGMMKW